MRTGASTLQQALTAEAASVLKLSLSLARRRGHAQVTPLHVAATLLSSSSSSSSASNLLRRACLKSQPHHPASHPLQCRALELCFNVALNRLPTTPPPSSGPLLGSQPSLSNALIAALKRAQAHQRRGCIELQQQQLQQQQQPLLAIKVELEQLIISILDDPSVSRVMREAGFSSTCVKNSLEEESSILSQSSPFLLDSHKDITNHGSSFWQTPLFKLSSRQSPPFPVHSSQKEDLNAVMEVMLRKQGRRNNAVVVGESCSMSEGLVAELMAMVEKGEVPGELKAAHFIKLHLSYVHLRLMSRTDVDLKVSDLRRKIVYLASDRIGGGVVIYAGDLRWAIDEEAKDGNGFKPVEHMVAELGRLLSEFRSSNGSGGGSTVNNKVWLMATASYHTYMRCQMRQPSLETQWALQAVVVPSGGLALSLQAPSGLESRLTKLFEFPFQLFGTKNFSNKDDEKLSCCAECTSSFDQEALVLKSEMKDASCGSIQLPCWLQRQKPENNKDALLELKRKWNSLCQSLHHRRQNQLYPPFLNQNSLGKNNTCSSYPWWPNNSHSKMLMQSHSLSFSETTAKLESGFPFNIVNLKNGICNWQERDEAKIRLSEVGLNSLKKPGNQDVGITLSLGSALVSDSATSNKNKQVPADRAELTQKLQENMPWQSEMIPLIVESLSDDRSCENKGLFILLQGSDCISKRRLARVMSEHFCGSDDRLIQMNMRKWASKASSCREALEQSLEKDSKFVVFIEDIDRADDSLIGFLVDALKVGAFGSSSGKQVNLSDTIFIMTTSNSENYKDESKEHVIKMKLQAEERSADKDLKRKPETELQSDPKRARTEDHGLDLNMLAEVEMEEFDGDEAAPSDLTNETDCRNPHLPSELLELVTARFTMERSGRALKDLLSKLHLAFDEVKSGCSEAIGRLVIDEAAVEELMAASGSYLESGFERWVREVFQTGLQTVKVGGNVRLSVEGKKGNVEEFGFMGSVLPRRIDVE
ncbi:hypothetical protein Cni_G28562 [Canna indica]|uniref:Clp R domain-containing protein n=1 Tax=Canna indica TaxID=4628 RepID=A0AAQ3L440_9LILI|nr:hypothetical protein Cni_G28562 [Canna indica]